MKNSERIVLNEEEVSSLLERISASPLKDSDKKIITGIIRIYQQVQFALQETKISITRLCNLFGFKQTEKRRYFIPPTDSSEEEANEKGLGEKACDQLGLTLRKTLGSLKKLKDSLEKEKKKGHGRLGHKDYPGANIVNQEHESLKPGDSCPENCGGRLYAIDPKTTVCLTGHALASATKYLQSRCRCALCGKVFTAKPAEGMPSQKYDEALKANLAIAKNYAGMPFYRLQMLQKMVGVPLPHPTQWQLVESLADAIYPVYYELERLAAQGKIISHDDTTVRILSIMEENKRKAEGGEKGRTGMFTTGIVSQVGQYVICLFLSGRCHSGENMTKILEKRFPELAPVIRMADALSSNLSVEFINILCKCLAHGRRKFYEIYNYFPGECRIMIDGLAIVYHYDSITKQEKMGPEERLAYHQTHSAPIMAALKEWMVQKLEKNEVEPNGSLGKAINYMLKHWDGLTRFLHVPGAYLDNNITERALKIPIRSRKNSLFYKTEHGAFVGSMLTSIIHTCVMSGENPVDYLIALQTNKKALFKSPQNWLPWTYKETLQRPPPSPPPLLRQAA
jgi:transposase